MQRSIHTVILGAGLTGLSAAYFLKKNGVACRVYEKESFPGGLASSYRVRGFTFDVTGHLLHFRHPEFRRFVQRLLPRALVRVERKASIYSHGGLVPYPFQANLAALPPKVRRVCFLEFAKAWKRNRSPRQGDSFKAWARHTFGKGIAENFMLPYNEKLWCCDLSSLSADWVSWSVPRPSFDEVLDGALGIQKKAFGYNPTFYYPRRGGISAFSQALARRVKGITFDSAAQAVSLTEKKVHFSNGHTARYERLISTLPLNELVGMTSRTPSSVRRAASKLRSVNVMCLNLGFRRPTVCKDHWVYFPEKEFSFYRIGFPSNFAPSLAPRGCSTAYVEVAYPSGKGRPRPTASYRRVVKGLLRWGAIRKESDIALYSVKYIEPAYVIFDRARPSALKTLRSFYEKHGIFSVGRYGQWDYLSMEDSLRIGKDLPAQLAGRKDHP